jgi:hypothetical protein
MCVCFFFSKSQYKEGLLRIKYLADGLKRAVYDSYL